MHAPVKFRHLTLFLDAFLALTLGVGAVRNANAAIELTTSAVAATENFNGLASTGTSSTVPAGWAFAETGTNANSTYTAGTGSGTAGDTYSFGSTSSSDRAFGGLQSGTLVPTIGAEFKNSIGVDTIISLLISYTGEQWRFGDASRTPAGTPDRLDFQYSTNATSLTTGTWTDVNSLDFTSPITSGPVGALNGNAAANRTSLSATISGLSIAAGAKFWIRWTDFNVNGSDDGLAVDDFSLTPIAAPEAKSLMVWTILCGCVLLGWNRGSV